MNTRNKRYVTCLGQVSFFVLVPRANSCVGNLLYPFQQIKALHSKQPKFLSFLFILVLPAFIAYKELMALNLSDAFSTQKNYYFLRNENIFKTMRLFNIKRRSPRNGNMLRGGYVLIHLYICIVFFIR